MTERCPRSVASSKCPSYAIGTHEELMARKGHYADLYGIQAAAYR